MTQLMQSSRLLTGDNTIPGVKIPKEVLAEIPGILTACREFGLDFYETVVEFLTYDEISEVAAYGGFPVRYPHWQFGEQYEELSKGYQHGYHRIFEMVVNCCQGGTHLLSDKGSKVIEEIAVGDRVYSREGKSTVVAVVKQPPSDVVQINLKEFGSPPVCTPNHRWLVLRGINKEWVRADELKPGDLVCAGGRFENFLGVAAPIDWDKGFTLNETAPNVRWKLKDINPPKTMTLALAELMGICTGDGSCGVPSAENYIAVCVDKRYSEFSAKVLKLFYETFNVPASLEEKKSVDVVLMSSKYAVDFFDKAGYKKGSTYDTKRVPSSIWASSNEYRAAYLRGLFDTDGYMCRNLGISLKNEQLINDVQLLLLEMGIRSRVHHILNKHNDIWCLTIKGRANVMAFHKYIGFSLNHKREKLEHTVNCNYAPGKGFVLPEAHEEVLRLISELPDQNKFPTRIRGFRRGRTTVGVNSLWCFVQMMMAQGYAGFEAVNDLLETPLYEVDSVVPAGQKETWDIALGGDAHDFLANGLVSHNTNPCYIYCLDSNTLLDNITVIAHATGHNDFFKKNVFFSHTSQNMMNELANHGSRIRRYMAEWGKETVGRLIDKILCIGTLIDPASAWDKRQIREPVMRQKREYNHPRRLRVDHDYMEGWINTPEWLSEEQERIDREDIIKQIGIFSNPTRNIFGFLKDNAPLTLWQQDVMAMLYEEAMYFSPQRLTKTINEGWASFCDSQIMARYGFANGSGIFDYAAHKASVLGGKQSMNPYKLGYMLFLWIEECWNKGRFGRDYEACEDVRLREAWDKKLGLGHEKVFEVRQFHNDVTMIADFFDQEFCDKYEFFVWERFPNGEYKIVDRDANRIKKMLIQQKLNGGLPDIKLVDPNHKGKRIFLMEHTWDGRTLHPQMTKDTLLAISALWQGPSGILSKDKDEREIMYYCEDEKVDVVTPGKI